MIVTLTPIRMSSETVADRRRVNSSSLSVPQLEGREPPSSGPCRQPNGRTGSRCGSSRSLSRARPGRRWSDTCSCSMRGWSRTRGWADSLHEQPEGLKSRGRRQGSGSLKRGLRRVNLPIRGTRESHLGCPACRPREPSRNPGRGFLHSARERYHWRRRRYPWEASRAGRGIRQSPARLRLEKPPRRCRLQRRGRA